MKIIKAGKLPKKEIKFDCAICECVFVALNTEYEWNTIMNLYSVRCPCCGVECYSEEKVGW